MLFGTEKYFYFFLKKAIDKLVALSYNKQALDGSDLERTSRRESTREWRNWQTRTFEGRVVHTVRVQVPFPA